MTLMTAVAWTLSEIQDYLRAEMSCSQERHAANTDRKQLPAPRLLHKVWLDARNIVTRRPSRKLDRRRLGLIELVADPHLRTPFAVRLRLPEIMQPEIYPVKRAGYGRPTWEDAAGIGGVQAIDRSLARHPQKLGYLLPGVLTPLPPPPDLHALSFAGAQRLGRGYGHGPGAAIGGSIAASASSHIAGNVATLVRW